MLKLAAIAHPPITRAARALRATLTRLARERRGNVFIIVAFAMIPMVFATGMGIDYSRAARLRTKLNAVADAAALAAVTQSAMQKDDDEAEQIAIDMFNAQAEGLANLIIDPLDQDDVDITKPDGPTSRTATVTYTAKSINLFGSILNMRTIAIGGTATAKAIKAPDMDFYIALDTSPSMALPTTSAGFTTMDTALNCSFACHSNKIENYVAPNTIGKLPSRILYNDDFNIKGNYGTGLIGTDEILKLDAKGTYVYVNKATTDPKCMSDSGLDICVYNADPAREGTYVDSYWYALNQGVQLRVTAERDAIKDVMALAQSYAVDTGRTYHAGLYTFDHGTNFKTIAKMPDPDDPANLADVGMLTDGVDLVRVNDKGVGLPAAPDKPTKYNGCPPEGCTGSNRYLFTSFQSVLTKMANDILPNKSGQGTDADGDTPQAFLFIVTDGMSDEDLGTGKGRTRKAMQEEQITQCNAIKGRGIKIAILYTEYTAESIKDDEPNQRDIAEKAIPDIAPQLTKCASPDLMYTVKTDESISGALQSLFRAAIATAHLTK